MSELAPTAARRGLQRSVERLDFFRRSPSSVGGRGGHKEWHHFCVLGPDVELLANFSLSDDVRPGAPHGSEIPRLTVLARDREWDGDVDAFEPEEVHVAGGRVDLRFGDNRLRFVDGCYRISLALRDRPVRAELDLVPRTLPSLAPNIPLPEGPPLHWVIVPRLEARGWVAIGGREHRLQAAPAYHDHNFGHFLWGHAFSWIWGFGLPPDRANPWSIAFVRLSNRLRTCALAQGIFLWKGEHLRRVFRENDLDLRMELDHLRPARLFKVPRIMALLSPEAWPDVPRVVQMRADADGDALDIRFEGEDVGQVIIPSETDSSVTIINEVSGRLSVGGRVGGNAVAMEGRGFCEFLST